MRLADTPPVNHVIYAKNLQPMAAFYRRTLALSVVEDSDACVVIGDGLVEIVLVRIPDRIAATIEWTSPPVLREETPIKASFVVDDLDRVAAEAAATGGGVRTIDSAWVWRGQRHLDGYDPEGNVVQFRQRVADIEAGQAGG